MRMKSLTAIAAASIVLFSATAQANIIAFAPAGLTEDLCNQIEGNWAGSGVVSGKVMFKEFRCEYNGHGTISKVAGNPHEVLLNVTLNRTSGPCGNDPVAVPIKGICSNEKIDFKTPDADLTADLSNGGREANLHGTVTFYVDIPVVGKKQVTANVEKLHLHKQ